MVQGNVGTTANLLPLGYLTTDAAGATYLGSGQAAATIALNTQAQAGANPATAAGPANHNGDQNFSRPGDPLRWHDDQRKSVQLWHNSVYPTITFGQTVDSLSTSHFGLTVLDPSTTWFMGSVGATTTCKI